MSLSLSPSVMREHEAICECAHVVKRAFLFPAATLNFEAMRNFWVQKIGTARHKKRREVVKETFCVYCLASLVSTCF